MLPGFRFLFAAIALSVSILVFGLGAAALLRAAHEEFASNSSWRAAPEQPIIAQQSEPAKPILAMLRFDPPHPAAKAPEPAAVQEGASAPIALAAPAEQNAVAAPAAEARTLAALDTKDTAPSVETTKAEDVRTAAAVANDAKSAPVIATDAAARAEETRIPENTIPETKLAAVDAAKPSAGDAPSAAVGVGSPEMMKLEPVNAASPEPANTDIAASEPAKPEPAAAAPPPVSDPAAADPAPNKIATLGGPAVAIEDVASKQAEDEKAERSVKAQRRAEAREKARRRAAVRARLARRQALAQQAAQQAANPFAPVASVAPQAPARQTASARTVQLAQ